MDASTCQHERGPEQLALEGDESAAIDVCLKCGTLAYWAGEEVGDEGPASGD